MWFAYVRGLYIDKNIYDTNSQYDLWPEQLARCKKRKPLFIPALDAIQLFPFIFEIVETVDL